MNRYRAHPPSRHNDNIPWRSSPGNRNERDPQNPRTAGEIRNKQATATPAPLPANRVEGAGREAGGT